jgi:hypothetical protein
LFPTQCQLLQFVLKCPPFSLIHKQSLLLRMTPTETLKDGFSLTCTAASIILFRNTCSLIIVIEYTKRIMVLSMKIQTHTKKSIGVRSGDLAGQGTTPLRPIQVVYPAFSQSRTSIEKWGGAPTSWKIFPAFDLLQLPEAF